MLTTVVAVLLIVSIVVGIVYSSFFRRQRSNFSAGARMNTINLEKMDLTTSVSATGTLESADSCTVSATVSNVEVLEVYVSEGDSVKKGQSLLTFDKTELNDALERAQQSLSEAKLQVSQNNSQAKRQVTNAKETYNSNKKELKASVADAKTKYTNLKTEVATLEKDISSATDDTSKATLKEKLNIAETNLTQAKTAYEKAVEEQSSINKQNYANLQNAQSQLELTKLNSQKTLREAQNNVDDAKDKLEDCVVKAPMAGTITSLNVAAGDVYSGGSMLEISDCTQFNVVTSVDEYDVSKLKAGQKVILLTESTDDEEFEGEITHVALTTGSSISSQAMGEMNNSSSNSGGYTVKIKVNQVDSRMRIGMTARCSIILEEREQVFAVPYDAIHTNADGQDVIYVVDASSENNGQQSTDNQNVENERNPMRQQGFEQKEIVVEKGMESDYYVEITGDDLEENMSVIIPSDEVSASSGDEQSDAAGFGMMGGMSGGDMRGGMSGGGMRDGMPNGGMPR